MKLKSTAIFTGIYFIPYDIVHLIWHVRVIVSFSIKWSSVKVASKNSANGLPINIQRTESTTAVFVTLMLSFLLIFKVNSLQI